MELSRDQIRNIHDRFATIIGEDIFQLFSRSALLFDSYNTGGKKYKHRFSFNIFDGDGAVECHEDNYNSDEVNDISKDLSSTVKRYYQQEDLLKENIINSLQKFSKPQSRGIILSGFEISDMELRIRVIPPHNNSVGDIEVIINLDIYHWGEIQETRMISSVGIL
jgi:hypothetical protein